MKIIVITNRIFFIATLILFTTIWLGFIAEIIFGLFQILVSFLLIFWWNKMTTIEQKKLIAYWLFTSLYGLGWLIDWGNLDNNLFAFIFGTIIIPFTLAIHLTLLIENLKNTL